eukprot:gene10526-10686_t
MLTGPVSLPLAQQDAEQAEQQHEQPQQLPPAAHAAPETASQGLPAAKRRRRTLTTDEQFVSRAVDPRQVLANVVAEVDGFQATMATLQDKAIGNGAHATATGKHADRQHKSHQPFIPLEQLKSLQVTLAAGKQAGVLQQLEHEQLRRLLLLLVEHVKLGIDQPLGEHDKGSDASSKAVAGALDAACCCMQLLAAPGLPNTLYLEELLAATVQMAKYQLQHNVLSLHDAHFMRLYRPSSAQDDDVQPAPTKKRARVEASGSKVSRALADVCAKLELLLSLLAQVIGQVKLEVELVLPLVRVALMCLSVDSLQLLQVEAIALAVAVFRAYPEQRLALMDEVMTTVLSKIQCSSARGPPRLYQVSVQLPAVEAEPGVIQRAYLGSLGWSDKFWEGVFARLPAAKAAKSDGATDFKAVTDALLTDLLALQMLPEWPAATLLLRRFVKMLYSDKGLHHPDAAVKLAAVDFTGQLASRLCAEATMAEQEAYQVQAVLEEALRADVAGVGQLPTGQSGLLALDHLLLDYLAAVASTDNSSTGTAGSPELQLSRAQIVGLVRRRVVEGPLGAMRGTLIQCLVEAGSRSGPDPNPATVRTKVLKCLGCVVEADSRVLGLPHVAAAVRAALEDDSVAVREATLELLAKLIHTNPSLAGDYFDVLAQATHDPGISVRKRAIKSLWDCCTCPGFSRGADAVVAVLQRAADPEDSMRGLVTKICGEMWFTETSSFAGLTEDDGTAVSSSSSSTVRSPQVRARELAEVSFRMFEARGKGINVPWPADNPLIVIFQEVLGLSSSAGYVSGSRVGAPSAKELKDTAVLREGAADVAGALLSMFLQLQQDQREEGEDHALVDSSSSSSHSRLSYLLALHALCIADAGLAAPVKDPQRFVRALAPYVDSAAQAAADAADKAVLGHLEALEKDLLQQLSADMIQVLKTHRIPQCALSNAGMKNCTECLELCVSSEEAALVSRQKDIEAAAATSRLASTLPTTSKRPLSRVNGETDVTAASSSSIIQNVWVDVLRLATGVPGEHSVASVQVAPGGGAGVDAMEAAATMRRKALELIEVVLRGGLVAPWDAIPPLVAQLTDTAPDTRQAAHRVLKTAADKYSDFVAGQLAPGVIEAYQFQSRLWAAKHPGQPLPKGPSAEVLEGLAAMYADIIHPDKNGATRQRFLSNLLKPFDASCNLANPSAAAREDIHKLAFCVYVAAALPFKRADEPLVLIHTINSHVSRQALGVADALRRQLYLMAAYCLTDERVAAFELKGDIRRSEMKALVSKDKKLGDFGLGPINLRSLGDATGQLLAELYKTFKGLLDNDAANYREAAVLAAVQDLGGEDDDAGVDPATHKASATPAAAAAGLVVFSMDTKKARSKSTSKRGGRSTGSKAAGLQASTAKGKGGRRAASTGRGKAKKRRAQHDSDDNVDDDDEEWEGDGKRKLW